ncbi:MAG TPA: N-6 DNA methylase [Acidimicrobiales bacterium]|nr:N-6 DNA methylase [Acidimicrobiales bacterium]
MSPSIRGTRRRVEEALRRDRTSGTDASLTGIAAWHLLRSKQRTADHGEVFTPPRLVEAMLDLVSSETERIDALFLEPACGSGNFLVPILQRKLATVQARYGRSGFEKHHYALLALMSVYGIELLADNVAECRGNLLEVFAAFVGVSAADDWYAAAVNVLDLNIVHGDALSMMMQGARSEPIMFAEWSYLGKGEYHRRDFRFDTLTQMSSFGEEGTLFADLGKHQIFTPTRDHGSLVVSDIARDSVRNA